MGTFTLELDELCSCSDPCGDCCISTACCANAFPYTLYCTIVDNGGNCSCGDGTIVTLTYDITVNKWGGIHAFGTCPRNVTFYFYCSGGGTLTLEVIWSDSCAAPATYTTPAGTCDPVNFTFGPFIIGGLCCSGFAGNSLKFVVTQ